MTRPVEFWPYPGVVRLLIEYIGAGPEGSSKGSGVQCVRLDFVCFFVEGMAWVNPIGVFPRVRQNSTPPE